MPEEVTLQTYSIQKLAYDLFMQHAIALGAEKKEQLFADKDQMLTVFCDFHYVARFGEMPHQK